MSFVRRKVFICDHCGEVKQAQISGEWPFEYIEKPCGWGEFGGYHLCPECYSAWRKLKKQAESEGDNG